ncbi:unnamed protein product [Vitrella brassicaformis CCMP3155]|uniref:Exonuclease domain-containing protein n=1 Tax=Vitrella brassicaformis (strain CCMP3155) TaxID=1169540 RepID=A0A0G4EXH9_VITBC|nr:unnamed protein product [Vitrella brassicaformis CCMP3155]|eukprot:CEM03513.1 unnamed protein product [Vitrella brassicaformis CCMP3155]
MNTGQASPERLESPLVWIDLEMTGLDTAKDMVIEAAVLVTDGQLERVIEAGNSVHVDRRFLVKDMPKLERYLHYRIVDVSTVKELCRRWYPAALTPPLKKGRHRALEDIRESIEELKFYRSTFA